MKATILSGLMVLAMPALAFSKDKCADAMDQATMNECANVAFKKSDSQLNELYKKIETRLSDNTDTKKLLAQAQRAWIKFRDAECDFQRSASAGGSVMPMIISMCMDGMTQSRIKDLQNYLNCKEGDMSCPVPSAN
ncbi:lysozyme inhibitor LprI family protein [Beijerinckia indica]|uniref:Lysozyme inhibitor LprI-like N-terminal domain-containing protein n=1 Tax=Beijerinckia indica subsp. indica (strain ATCC 9039 / DSM 1715 / NCIMB 8712) TaxID=395963 RepID=B2ICX5_BEII9|nr:lysozyme inhibitor LprI family protein [Beijerinckia indica]ACB95396.1 protein of unknown function DUF1311 [Beijerinckia indica subsp. indica ATCC 9039]